MYFPIDEHRADWTSDDETMIVAVLDHQKVEQSEAFLDAYDLNGNFLSLDVNKVPEYNTLVVAISETHGDYPKETDKINSALSNVIVPQGATAPQGINSLLKVYTFFCRDAVGDGIWGDPDYYLNVYHPNGAEPVRTNFYEVTESGVGYYLNRTVFESSANYPYNSTNILTTGFILMDDDGGLLGQDDIIQDLWGLSDNNQIIRVDWRIPTSLENPNHQIYWGHKDGAGFNDSKDAWLDIGWSLNSAN